MRAGTEQVTVINCSHHRPRRPAESNGVDSADWSELGARLAVADVIWTANGAPTTS